MKHVARNGTNKGRPKGRKQLDDRKQQVLTRKTPSVVGSIADALVIKDGDLYFLSQDGGDVPLTRHHGFGLYFQDTRFLSGYTLRLDGHEAHALVAANQGGYKAVIQLTNPALRRKPGTRIEAESIGVNWKRMLKDAQRSLFDVITFENYGLEAVTLPVTLAFRADFEDVFTVRGLLDERPGRLHAPRWESPQLLSFQYDGADDVIRRVSIHLSERPVETSGATARFELTIGPRARRELLVTVVVSEAPVDEAAPPQGECFPDLDQVEAWLHKSSDDWMADQTRVHSDSLLLDRILERCLRDLHTLRSDLHGEGFFAAGVPWFATLFGRDSLITALQTLAYNPALAEGALRLLAAYQGTKVDDWRDEQPGKMLHELRVGELANIDAIPHDPYYGTIDTTPLFLIVLARHAQWTGRLELFHALRDNVERALMWLHAYGDSDGDGYIDYTSGSKRGLVNQGWKDSGNAIVNRDGSLVTPPVAMVEVQGYVYMAKVEIADLYERVGDMDRARTLRQEAAALRERFNRDFWLEDMTFYALALQAGGKPAAVVSSNVGQALWTGIVDEKRACHVERRLMAPDMFSDWGVRTLSSAELRYNPNSYHLGSVWPHDNALIAAGLRRYGYDTAAMRIFKGLFEAASHFDQYRMPELFTGFSQADYGEPVRYPVACHPQAWAAGSLPFLLVTMLGLQPDGFNGRLRVVRPLLPAFVRELELHRVRVGRGHVSVRFQREGERTAVTVLNAENVELELEDAP